MEAVSTAFWFGPVAISHTVVTTWGIMVVMVAACALMTRGLEQRDDLVRTALEAVHDAIDGAVREAIPGHHDVVLPFVATLWLFLGVANLAGIVPGMHSPTGDLSTTAACAVLVFVAVHVFGIRFLGVKAYLKHYLAPSPILLPFHLISEVTRTVALTIRLFGNIMSLEMAAMLVVMVAGFLVPVPLLALHIIEALVQAYIFGVLALLYIGSALQHETSTSSGKEDNT